MTPILEREFYRSFRGPEIGAEDDWRLVLDPSTPGLRVRHCWRGARHNGVDEFSLEEFLTQQNAARDALVSLLFEARSAPPSPSPAATPAIGVAIPAGSPGRSVGYGFG